MTTVGFLTTLTSLLKPSVILLAWDRISSFSRIWIPISGLKLKLFVKLWGRIAPSPQKKKIMKIYTYSNTNGFSEIEVPSFEGYETMVSTAKDISAIVNGEVVGFDELSNCIETVEKVVKYYEDSNYEAKKTFVLMLNCLKRQLETEVWDNTRLVEAYKFKNSMGARVKAPMWNRTAKLRTLLRDMERGVVYYSADSSYTYGYRYWHSMNPAEDIYEYNGRKFYMWDGWHSSLKVMKEIADKKFNN